MHIGKSVRSFARRTVNKAKSTYKKAKNYVAKVTGHNQDQKKLSGYAAGRYGGYGKLG